MTRLTGSAAKAPPRPALATSHWNCAGPATGRPAVVTSHWTGLAQGRRQAGNTETPNRKVEINFTILFSQFYNKEKHETRANRKVGTRGEKDPGVFIAAKSNFTICSCFVCFPTMKLKKVDRKVDFNFTIWGSCAWRMYQNPLFSFMVGEDERDTPNTPG